MEESVQQRVLAVVKEVLNVEEGVDILNASIKEDLGAKSIDQMTLFITLEDEFKRNIPQENVAHLDTVSEIISYIETELGNTAT